MKRRGFLKALSGVAMGVYLLGWPIKKEDEWIKIKGLKIASESFSVDAGGNALQVFHLENGETVKMKMADLAREGLGK